MKARSFGPNDHRGLVVGKFLYPERLPQLPQRAECAGASRPCPHVRCRHHLYVTVTARGTLQLPNHEVWDAEETCALDVAERGPHTMAQVATILGLTAVRVGQIEVAVLAKLREIGSSESSSPSGRSVPDQGDRT